MSEENKQAVVDETKAPPAAVAEVADAREDGDDLDKLLSQFDEGDKPKPAPATQPEQKTDTGSDQTKAFEQVKGQLSEIQARQFRQDMDGAIKQVRGDLDPDMFDDALVESWMDAQARNDPRLAQAWSNRYANPKQYQKVVETLGRNFVKKYSKLPDKAATEDREAVTAAVRGASTKASEGKAPDMSKLTQHEFEAEKEKLFG